MMDAQTWIDRLGLEPHPEGGYFRETYRSARPVAADGLDGPRPAMTAIYFLLTADNCSNLHRLTSAEGWHFHDGDPVTIHVIDPDGSYRTHRVGLDLGAGQEPTAVVPAGCWFGATVDEPGRYALVSCTVAPGFDFDDFELAERHSLTRQYPQHKALIERLTRPADETP